MNWKIEIFYKDVQMYVEYDYTPAEKGDYFQPAEPSSVEVNDVLIYDTSIMDLLSLAQLREISDRVCEKHDEELWLQ
jgi:hypothetical protein